MSPITHGKILIYAKILNGPLMNIPPTGKKVELTAIDILRFENGKMVEHWGNQDLLGMMQQLGVIPVPGQTN